MVFTKALKPQNMARDNHQSSNIWSILVVHSESNVRTPSGRDIRWHSNSLEENRDQVYGASPAGTVSKTLGWY